MTFNDIPVPPISQPEVESAALAWSRLGTPEGREIVDVLYLYERANVTLLERSDIEMGADEARAAPALNRVFVRRSLLQRLEAGDLHATMDLAHEFGHVVLHRGPEMKARKVGGNAQERFITEEESAEAQAWRFARALMMPLAIVKQIQSAEELAAFSNVPIEHARLRMAEAARLLPKPQSAFVEGVLRQKKSPAQLREERKAREARELLRVWNAAERIPGDRLNSRLCSQRKWRVLWSEHNQMTECGWVLKEGKIVAWKDLEGG
jgi:hypothetical protein